jgi:hypothetical protein
MACSTAQGFPSPQKAQVLDTRYPPIVSRKPQPDYGDVPKQKTLKGTEIPLPKRGEIMDAFRRIVKPSKTPSKG